MPRTGTARIGSSSAFRDSRLICGFRLTRRAGYAQGPQGGVGFRSTPAATATSWVNSTRRGAMECGAIWLSVLAAVLSPEYPMRIAGIILIIVGIVGLAYGGITYTPAAIP